MATSGSTKTELSTKPDSSAPTLARVLAPEDVRAGDFVAVLDELFEVPSYWWCEDAALHPRDELVRIRVMPTQENPPQKVKSVCLPFVLVKQPSGEKRTLDLRRQRLARLDRRYGRVAWKAYRKKTKLKKSSGCPDRATS
jgi:hypothetical protein